jgi:transposase
MKPQEDEDKDPPKENKRNARPKKVDRTERNGFSKLPRCKRCGTKMRRKGSFRKRVVIHIPIQNAEAVRHESEVCVCPNCGKEEAAPIPNVLPKMEFDITTVVLISYLSTAAKMSVSDIRKIFRILWGLDISEGSITNSMKRLKFYLGPYYDELLKRAKSAFARYKDETSHKHNGETFWAWVIATKNWVYYTIEKSHSHKIAKKLDSKHGCDIADGLSAYSKLLADIQRCWAHLSRRAKKPKYPFGDAENFTEYKKFVERLGLLLHNAKLDKKKLGVSKRLRKLYDNKMWELLKSAPTQGRNIARVVNYIMKFDGQWFAFLQYNGVEPTNNFAELMMRPLVLKRRVSQQSRGIDNMQSYAMQISLYESMKLQGRDYTEVLTDILESSVSGRRYEL